jgi:hypothetical protein
MNARCGIAMTEARLSFRVGGRVTLPTLHFFCPVRELLSGDFFALSRMVPDQRLAI